MTGSIVKILCFKRVKKHVSFVWTVSPTLVPGTKYLLLSPVMVFYSGTRKASIPTVKFISSIVPAVWFVSRGWRRCLWVERCREEKI